MDLTKKIGRGEDKIASRMGQEYKVVDHTLSFHLPRGEEHFGL